MSSQAPFRILDLPRELRDQIWAHLLSRPYPITLVVDKDLTDNKHKYRFRGIRYLPTAIMRTSKAIHEETSTTLFTKNIISIFRCDFVDPLSSMRHPIPWTRLRRARCLKVSLGRSHDCACNAPMIDFLGSLSELELRAVQVCWWPRRMTEEWEVVLKPLRAIFRNSFNTDVVGLMLKGEMEAVCPGLFEMYRGARIVGGLPSANVRVEMAIVRRMPSARMY
ncbi:hypothetical protein EG328_001485 [Venturia inaequalis]|uniref:Uncharacterized protein n=1 Tax=Venturia inaequalis TaxID=5025 RepID=A0A8H3UXC4_VENIN|nr:hypothetical protein EG328_001485 [Venturia inaequalis]